MSATPFRDNVVVLTGASTGIGREMGLQLAEQGGWLVLAARDGARRTAVAEFGRIVGISSLTGRTGCPPAAATRPASTP